VYNDFQIDATRRCAVTKITRQTRKRAGDKHKRQLAREYSEAAKQSTEVSEDLQGTINDGLHEIEDVADLKRERNMFETGASSNGSPKRRE
jgi:hypothetical protein